MILSRLLTIYWMPLFIKTHLTFVFTYFTIKGWETSYIIIVSQFQLNAQF